MLKYEYKGIKGITNIATYLGVSYKVFKSRLDKHNGNINLAAKDIEKSESKSQQRREYQGIIGLKNIAKHVGISSSTLEKRMYQDGMTLEQAIEHKPQCTYEYNGISGLANLARYYGMSASCIQNRVASGMTIEQALLSPVRKFVRKTTYKYEYNGYKGLEKIAARYDVNQHALSMLLRQGVSMEDAIYQLTEKKQIRKVDQINKEKTKNPKRRKGQQTKKCTNPDLLSNSWRLALGMSHA